MHNALVKERNHLRLLKLRHLRCVPSAFPQNSKPGYWQIKPRRFVAVSAAFIWGTAHSIFHFHYVCAVLIAMFAFGILPLFGIRAKSILLLLVFAIGGFASAQVRQSNQSSKLFLEHDQQVEGTVTSVRHRSDGLHSLRIKPVGTAFPEGSSLFILCKQEINVCIGDTVHVLAKFKVSESKGKCKNNFKNKRSSYYAFCKSVQKIETTTASSALKSSTANDFAALGKPLAENSIQTPFALAGELRTQIVKSQTQRLGEKNGKLLASMIFGNRAVTVDRQTRNNFRKSGLSHILAASGFNLSILAAAVYFVCRHIALTPPITASLSLISMMIFLFFAGPSPSVMRALVMGSILLYFRAASRNAHLPAVLCLTSTVLLVFNPSDIADIGFQLSYASTLGLIINASWLQNELQKRFKLISPGICAAISATTVAQLYVIPLQIFYFKQINPYFLPANLAAAALTPILTIMGFVQSAVFVAEEKFFHLTFFSNTMLQILYCPLELLRGIALIIAALPGSQINTPECPLWLVIIYYAVLAAVSFRQLQLQEG